MITQQFDLSAVSAKFSDARAEQDGAITFECPACRDEGHHNKRIKLFASGALACARFASAGKEANREHCAPIREALGIGAQSSAFISESLFDGKLTLEVTPAERGKVLLLARNCSKVLHRDVLSLDKAADRAKFIKELDIEDGQKKPTLMALLELADRFDSVRAAIEEEGNGEAKQVVFADLLDGRLIEQVAGRTFAVYDSRRGEVTYQHNVECDAGVYTPLEDDFVLKGGLFLPERLIEYGDDATLDAEIEACIDRYSDVSARERKLSGKYVRLSYIADKLNEISYFRATGERGSGKSRYICAVGMLCLRPILVTSPSAASLYRMMDAYQPTLIIDECNFAEGSEDTAALLQILNCGFQRLTNIPRMDKGTDGRMTLRMFSAFGPKLIGSLKLSDSSAFESRCVAVKLQKTARKDIPFRLTDRMLRDFAELRAKLYLWRLRNWSRDYEQALDDAESELKGYQIEPRFVQIAIPVYGMIADARLKTDFARMLEGRTDDAASEQRQTFDGQLTEIVHGLLFAVSDESKASWRTDEKRSVPNPGELCLFAEIEEVDSQINGDGRSEKERKSDLRKLGLAIRKLGFKTRQESKGEWRKRRFLVYDPEAFSRQFQTYSLPVPEDLLKALKAAPVTDYEPNSLAMPQVDPAEYGQVATQGTSKLLDSLIVTDSALSALSENLQIDNTAFRGQEVDQLEAIFGLVALDTETERFDQKRGITARNARMIGMSLSYDGDWADYVTDREAWPMMLPEPEQTVIFHNAKFDLGAQGRAGLPTPEKWEDTMIAAHLVNENGAHGLKPLAKELLDIEEPVSFEEADKLRLLDPEIFNEYAKNDARFTFRLWPKLKQEMEGQELMPVYDLEKRVVPVVMAMERAGMKLDVPMLATLGELVTADIEHIKAEAWDYAGCRFDLNSPAKVAAILFDKLGVPSGKTTGKGQRSVDKETLEDVRGFHPAVDAVLRYRELDKLANTFIKTLPEYADEAGRVHPEFKQLGAKTGRFSCADPNVQQIPARSELGKKLRAAFIAEAGHKLVVADWSQMELRVLAQYSKDPLLLEAYTAERETDLHTLTAARMFGKAEADVTKPERSIAKMINFGIAYGITPRGLFNRLKPQGVDVTEAQCEQFIADYFKTYPGVRKFLKQVEIRVRERGYVCNWFGRRRRVTGQTWREVRQAQNFIIQATAADLAKMAMVRLHSALPEGARLIAMVHDEFIVECRAEQAEAVRDLMIETMSQLPEGFTIPLRVDAHIGNNWGECK